ncbi:MAG: HAD-IA family hydrolase [Thermoleophilaceae bacterium]
MISVVISDFGGVLTTPLVDSFLAYQRDSGITIEELGVAMAAATATAGGAHPLFELEKGNISEAEFLRRVESELPDGKRLHAFSETFFANLHANEPIIAYMRGVRGRGLRTALLTNNVREWEPLWRAKLSDIDEIFEVIVDSAFVGMRKPDPEIYELLLERLGGGVRAEQCVFLDDIEANCDAARALGMTAVHFRENEQAIAELDRALGAQAP